jgi:hypothetical protein
MKVNEMVNAIIRSTVAFFAATVGFGLKHLLEINPDTTSPDLATNSWLCFLIVGLHAARFLLGSSAHLTGTLRQSKHLQRVVNN